MPAHTHSHTVHTDNVACVSISCTQSSSLALSRRGELFAWGYNGNGQLGIGSYVNQNTPRRVHSQSLFIHQVTRTTCIRLLYLSGARLATTSTSAASTWRLVRKVRGRYIYMRPFPPSRRLCVAMRMSWLWRTRDKSMLGVPTTAASSEMVQKLTNLYHLLLQATWGGENSIITPDDYWCNFLSFLLVELWLWLPITPVISQQRLLSVARCTCGAHVGDRVCWFPWRRDLGH